MQVKMLHPPGIELSPDQIRKKLVYDAEGALCLIIHLDDKSIGLLVLEDLVCYVCKSPTELVDMFGPIRECPETYLIGNQLEEQ